MVQIGKQRMTRPHHHFIPLILSQSSPDCGVCHSWKVVYKEINTKESFQVFNTEFFCFIVHTLSCSCMVLDKDCSPEAITTKSVYPPRWESFFMVILKHGMKELIGWGSPNSGMCPSGAPAAIPRGTGGCWTTRRIDRQKRQVGIKVIEVWLNTRR